MKNNHTDLHTEDERNLKYEQMTDDDWDEFWHEVEDGRHSPEDELNKSEQLPENLSQEEFHQWLINGDKKKVKRYNILKKISELNDLEKGDVIQFPLSRVPEKQRQKEPSLIDRLKEYHGFENVNTALTSAKEKNLPLHPIIDKKGKILGVVPNYEATPTGKIGQGKPNSIYDDPFSWVDSRFGASRKLLASHDKPVEIHTSSDLIGHDDYLENIPYGSTIHFYGQPKEASFPSDKRLKTAGDRISNKRKDVKIVYHDILGKLSLQKGARGDWQQEGMIMKYREHPDKRIKRIDVSMYTPDQLDKYGRPIEGKGQAGFAVFKKNIKTGTLHPLFTHVDEKHKRKGIASALYAHAEEKTGFKIVPSVKQSEEAKKLWGQPERKFGKSLQKSWYIRIKDEPEWHKVKDIMDLGPGKGNSYILENGREVHQDYVIDLDIRNNEENQDNLNKSDAKHIATIAVISGNKILMAKRRDNQKFTPPGGHINPDETPLQGAFRELKEEAGIEPEYMHYLGSEPVIGPSGKNLIIHCFSALGKFKTTVKNDPDKEVKKWEYIDISNGLPEEVKNNLHAPKNVLLKKLGLLDN